jgi:hypothetical protein
MQFIHLCISGAIKVYDYAFEAQFIVIMITMKCGYVFPVSLLLFNQRECLVAHETCVNFSDVI